MTEAAHGKSPYRLYWITWAILLAVTVGMLAAEALHLPKWFLIVFLLSFMMVKATMIGANFMHLRFEKRNLAFMVAAAILVTSLVLYLFVSQESVWVLTHTVR